MRKPGSLAARRPRRLRDSVALTGALLSGWALTGCVASGPSPEEARSTLFGALDDTQAELGGTWRNLDDPTPRGCLVAWWTEGIQYPALRIGPDPVSAEEALRTVREAWEQWGYHVERTPVGEAVELQGERAGELLVFRVSDDGMTLHGQSQCRPEQGG